MAEARVTSVGVWTDVEAVSGSERESVFVEPLQLTDLDQIRDDGHISPQDRLALTVNADEAAMDDVQAGKVIRVELADGEIREWRVWKHTTERAESGGTQAFIECRSIAWDLFTRTPHLERVESNRADVDFTVQGLTPTEWIDDVILATDGWPSWIVRGTVDATEELGISLDGWSAGKLMDLIAQVTGHEWTLTRNGSTNYQIEILSERGSTSRRPLVALRKNLASLAQETTAEKLATVVLPRGGGQRGFRSTIADARWNVDSTSTPNLLTQTEDFSHADWGTNGTPVITTDDATAPDGSATADKVEDDDGGVFERVTQTPAVSNDSLDRAASVYVRKQATFSNTVELGLVYSGGTVVEYNVQLNPETGDLDATRNDTPTAFGVEDVDDNWWRLWVVGANNSTGNTSLRWQVHPAINTSGADGTASAAATGSAHLWGAQLEQATSIGPYVVDPNGELLTLSDPAGGDGPVGFDDQFGVTSGSIAAHVEDSTGTMTAIMGSDASADTVSVRDGSNISANDLVPFRRNSSGDELVTLAHPSNRDTYGTWERVLDRKDIPGVQNLLSDVAAAFLDEDADADGVPDGWNKVGSPTVTQDTDAANHRHGSASAKVVASVGEGLISDAITVDPTSTFPLFSCEVFAKASVGTFQVQLVDATNGNRAYPRPNIDAAKNDQLNVFDTHPVAPGVNFDDLGTTSLKVRIVARGGSSTFWVDAAQLLHKHAPEGRYFKARGANKLWQAANDYLADQSTPEDRYELGAFDFYRKDTDRWPDDQIEPGNTIILKDPGLGVDAELRVVERERNLLHPGESRYQVDKRVPSVAERISERDIPELVNEAPAQSGSDQTAGSNINELNVNFGTLTAPSPPGMHARVGSMASDATFSGSMDTSGELRVAPFSPTQTFTVQSLKLKEGSVAGAGTARAAIYSDDGYYPDTLLYESGDLTLDGDNTEFNVSGPIIEMEAGHNYWVGAQITAVSSGSPELRLVAAGDSGTQAALGFDGNFGNQGYQALSSTGNGSTVPSVFPSTSSAVVQMLWCELEAPS